MVEKVNCVPYSATFSIDYCAKSHEKANTHEAIKNMWRQKCRRCPTGAACLGTDKYLERSALFKSKTCARCERQSLRLVGGWRCVSCYNRELENMAGLNAKGNPLKLIRHYFKAVVMFVARDGTIKKRELSRVMSKAEAVRSIQLTEADIINIKDIVLTPIKAPNQRQKRKITSLSLTPTPTTPQISTGIDDAS
jgi:hypothetical protein